MRFGTTCKFCNNPITLEISDDYNMTGDPHKLIPLAACDFCADLRVERRRLESKVLRSATLLKLTGKSDKNSREKLQKALTSITQDYADMIRRWHHALDAVWDPESVQVIMSKPDQWGDVLVRLWRSSRNNK